VINTATGANKTLQSIQQVIIRFRICRLEFTRFRFPHRVFPNPCNPISIWQLERNNNSTFQLKIGVTTETLVVNEAAPQIDVSSSTLTGQSSPRLCSIYP